MSTVQRFTKKPVTIEAAQLNYENRSEVIAWIDEASDGYQWLSWDSDSAGLTIRTLEGDMYATPGDWVIRGVKGEFYPCKPDIFAATYDTEGAAT